MEITFKVCDECGRIVSDQPNYEIKAIKNGLEDCGFSLCWPCYCELTRIINESCHLGAKRKLDEFIKEFNKNYAEITEE